MAKLKDDHIKWVLSLDAKGVQGELMKMSSVSKKLTADNKELKAELKLVTKQMQEAEKAVQKLESAGKKSGNTYKQAKAALGQNTQEYLRLTKQIEANKTAIDINNKKHDEMVRVMRIEDMTMAQLEKRAKDLEKQLKHTSEAADPAAYTELDQQLKAVEGRMGELGKGTKQTESVFPLLSGTAVKAMGAIAIGVAAAKKGLDLYETVMMSSRGTAVEFTAVMDGLSASFDYFKTSVANWDFSNFWDNAKKAFTAGSEASKMFENVHNMQNSFKLTSGQEIAAIEELKTKLRDVNLSNKERLAIGDQILDRTNKLADQEKKIYEENLNAAKRKLDSQAEFTDTELEFIIVNRNAQEENLEYLGKIKDLEKDLARIRENAKTFEDYSNDGQNSFYVKKLEEEKKNIEKYESLIENRKKAYGFEDASQYELMTSAIKKFADTDKEAVDAYVEARVRLNDIDIKTTTSLRQTQRMISTLTKKESGGNTTPEQQQRKALNELNEKIETKHQEEIAAIKEKYKSGEIKTEAEFNRKILAGDLTAYTIQKESLERFLDENKNLNKNVKSEVNKQLADLQNKRLDQEIKFRADLEKILLDADPAEKEKRAYQERLHALNLIDVESGEIKKNLTKEQHEALEILEKQHLDKMDAIQKRNDALAKAKSEKEFDEAFKDRKDEMQTELNELMLQASSAGSNSFDADMAVHIKRLQMLQKEIEARRAAGLEVGKQLKDVGRVEAQMTTTLQKEYKKRSDTFRKYSDSLGSAMGDVLSGQKSAFDAFGNAMIDILFDVLTQIINTKIVEATAVAVAEQAKATAVAAAMPDSVATFGVSGAVRSAAIGAIIMGALQAAKGALKGMIGKKSDSGTSQSDSPDQYKRVPKAYAEGGYHDAGTTGGYTGSGGRYEVAGAFSNGDLYHRDEYIIPSPVLKNPAAVPMIRALEAMRTPYSSRNALPDSFAEGGYRDGGGADSYYSGSSSGNSLQKTMEQMNNLLHDLRNDGVSATMNYRSFSDTKDRMDNVKQTAKKR